MEEGVRYGIDIRPISRRIGSQESVRKKRSRDPQGVKCQSYDGMGLLLGSGPFAILPFALNVLGSGSPYFLTTPLSLFMDVFSWTLEAFH